MHAVGMSRQHGPTLLTRLLSKRYDASTINRIFAWVGRTAKFVMRGVLRPV